MIAGLNRGRVNFVVIGGLAARAHGSTRITEDLDVCYDREKGNVRRVARVLARWRAYPRGIERGLPFVMDERTLAAAPVMTLTSDEGDIDVFDTVPGVGGYAEALSSSLAIDAGDVAFRVLDLPALIAAKRAAGRRRDLDHLPELEALLEVWGRRS